MDIYVSDEYPLATALYWAYAGDTIYVDAGYDASLEGPMYIGQSLTIVGLYGRARLPAMAIAGATLELREVEVVGSASDDGGTWSIGQLGGGLVLRDVVFSAGHGHAVSAGYGWVDAYDVVANGFRDASVVNLYDSDARFVGGSFSDNERGVFMAVSSSLVVDGVAFASNTALSETANPAGFEREAGGADVQALRSSVWLVGTTHQGSAADAGGAVLALEGTLDIQGATFSDTAAGIVGGAVAMARDDTDGDGLEDGPGTRFSISDTTFAGSTAGAGGAILILDGVGELRSVAFSDTYAVKTTRFGEGEDEIVGGGAIGGYGAQLDAHDVTIDRASALEVGGAVLFSGSDVAFRGLTVTNASSAYGGAIAAGASSVVIDGAALNGNSASVVGGAVFAFSPVGLSVQRAMLCGNDAPDGAAIGVARGAPLLLELRNSRVVQNVGGAAVAIFADDETSGGAPFVAENVTFADNTAAVGAFDGKVDVVNALVTGGAKGVVGPGAVLSVAYTGFYDVTGLVGEATLGEGVLDEADPKFAAVSCDATLWLGAGSAARDAGDPGLTDPDGTRSDMGAWGGPDADAIPDVDGDGHLGDQDCDDADPTAFPGAIEVWYDGRDGDCAGGDDHDQDGDGFGLGAGDCDDLDPERNPDAVDIENDRRDQDCDGVDNGQFVWVSSRGGCATTSGGGLAAALIAGLLVRRRRS